MIVEVSVGEVLDKLTILHLKKQYISDKDKLDNINKEYMILCKVCEDLLHDNQVSELYSNLLEVNGLLWQIEDDLREMERLKKFDTDFIELARSVYITNDKRAEIKKQINITTNSTLVEEKSYEQY